MNPLKNARRVSTEGTKKNELSSSTPADSKENHVPEDSFEQRGLLGLLDL